MTTALVIARVMLEQPKQYVLDEVIRNCETFNKASYKLYKIIADEIIRVYPKDSMFRGALNVGSNTIDEMIERIGKHYLGAPLHVYSFPYGSMGRDFSLIVTERLARNNFAVLNKVVSNLFAHNPKAKATYQQASGFKDED